MRLTGTGLALVDRLVEQHVADEHRLLAGHADDEVAELARLLTRWSLLLGE